jgi:hypothetical protein
MFNCIFSYIFGHQNSGCGLDLDLYQDPASLKMLDWIRNPPYPDPDSMNQDRKEIITVRGQSYVLRLPKY